MSDKRYNSFDDDVLANLEKLKAKYSNSDNNYKDDDISTDTSVKGETLYKHENKIPEKQPKEKAVEEYFTAAEYKKPEITPKTDAVKTDNKKIEKNTFSETVYTGSEENYSEEKETKKKKRRSSKKLTVILSLFIALIIWGALFAIDYVLVSSNGDPFFCVRTQEYDNGSENYTGLFYKYQRHVENNGTTESVCLPWFVKGPNDDIEKNDENSKKEEKVNASSDDLMPLEITIPAEFIEEDTTNGLELTAEQQKQGFESVKLNKNGSATYKIKKGDYRTFLTNLKTNLDKDLYSLADDKDYPSIKKVEFMNDLSAVTLYVDKEEYQNGLDRFIDQSIFEWVGRYKSFANQVPACDLIIKDIADGSIIDESKG